MTQALYAHMNNKRKKMSRGTIRITVGLKKENLAFLCAVKFTA
jgi:hypothetical protein